MKKKARLVYALGLGLSTVDEWSWEGLLAIVSDRTAALAVAQRATSRRKRDGALLGELQAFVQVARRWREHPDDIGRALEALDAFLAARDKGVVR